MNLKIYPRENQLNISRKKPLIRLTLLTAKHPGVKRKRKRKSSCPHQRRKDRALA